MTGHVIAMTGNWGGTAHATCTCRRWRADGAASRVEQHCYEHMDREHDGAASVQIGGMR